MKEVGYRQSLQVSALPTPSAGLKGVTVCLTTDNMPYWCDGSKWINQIDPPEPLNTWQIDTAPANDTFNSVCYGNGRFVAVASVGTYRIAYSDDGEHWRGVVQTGGAWDSVCYGAGLFIAMSSSTNVFATSLDGVTWTLRTLPAGTWKSVCYGLGRFVAVASSGTSRCAYSFNGIDWSVSSMPGTEAWSSVCFGNGKFVAVSSSGTAQAAYSLNGINWLASGITPPAAGYTSICFGGDYFVAVASSGEYRCIASTDGSNWTPAAGFNDATLAWKSVCYGGGRFLAVAYSGSNRFNFTTDPTGQWSRVDVSGDWYGCCFGNGKYVAVAAGSPIPNRFASAGSLGIDRGTDYIAPKLTLTASGLTDAPPTPGEDQVTLFAKQLANRVLPAAVGPSNMDYCMQPALWRQKIGAWNPPGNATTVPGVFGMGAPTALGTATARNVATTNLLTRTRRLGYVSAATAAAFAGHYSPAAQLATSDGLGLGGFFYSCRFAMTDAAAVAGVRAFVGLSSSVAAPTNVEPNTLTNCVGVAQLSSSSTQLYLVYGGSAAQTAIALGTNYPPMTAAGATNGVVYDLTLFAPPNDLNGKIYYRVERVGTNYVTEGVLPGSQGTAYPAATTLLAHRAWRCNNATLLACGIDVLSVYTETDY